MSSLGVKSNFYLLCAEYIYGAHCVYKTVLVVDILTALSAFFYVLALFVQNQAVYWPVWAWSLLVIFQLVMAVWAAVLLVKFNTHITSNTLHPATDAFLKFRQILVYASFAAAVIIPILILIHALMLGSALQALSTEVVVVLVLFMLVYAACFGVEAAISYSLQKSLTEANNVLGGTTSELKRNQIL